MKKSTWQLLVDGELHPVKYEDLPAPIVEILPADEDSLPRLRFTWWKREYIEIPQDAVVPVTVSPFMELRVPSRPNDGYFVWAIADGPEIRCLCNFRRYSWSWTSDPDGRLWYGKGVEYCNCNDAGLACTTPEQVVRETLIAAMWSNPEGVPKNVLWGEATQKLLPQMLEDALQNITDFAKIPIDYRARHGIGNYYL